MTKVDRSTQSMAMSILLESIIRTTYSQKSPGELLPLQWSIMRYLNGSSAQHASISYVARFLGLTHAPVSRSVATLKKRGLVESVATPEASRGAALVLTHKGHIALLSDPLKKVATAIDLLPEEMARCLALGVERLTLELNKKNEASR